MKALTGRCEASLVAVVALATGSCDEPKRASPDRGAERAPAPIGTRHDAGAGPEEPDARAAPRPEPSRPYNVLMIMVDSLRTDMPWNGYPRDVAPWLTAFEKRCVSYTHAYSLSSYTAKSVGPALIGEYPSATKRNGRFFTQYSDENLFVSERVQAADHRTLAGHAHGYFMPALGNAQGFDDYRLVSGTLDLKAVTSVTSDRLTRLAKEMLSDPKNTGQAEGRRFFAYFHYLDPHHTYVKHADHPDFGNAPRDRYDNEVHWTDRWVGELVDWALEQPWGPSTAVIVTADHGEGFGEHGHFRHSFEVWESLVHVPWFFFVPGAEPRRIDVPRSHLDLAPTIADLMGVEATPPFRGHSLVPELFGAPSAPRPVVVDLPRDDLNDRRRAVIADGYKIIAKGDDASWHLYDLERDPEEKRNLVDEDPEAFARMKKRYEAISAKIPTEPVQGYADLEGAPPGRRW